MALVSKSIPNLINGVSQQPAALRLESQGEVQENGFSDVVDGLKKRPPTKFLKKLVKIDPFHPDDNNDGYSSPYDITSEGHTTALTESEMAGAFFHTYKRSNDVQYQVVITPDKKVRVYDTDGNLRYESGHGSWDANGTWIAHNTDDTIANTYFTNDTDSPVWKPTDLTTTSVADATFIVNKNKEVAMSDEVFPSSDVHSALVYLKSINYGREYTVTVTPKEDVDSAFTVTSGTPNQINNVVAGDESNTEALRVSDVIGKTPAGSSRTNLRSQIIDQLGTAVATGSASAATTGWSNSAGTIPTSFLEIDFPEDVSGNAYNVAAWVAGSSTEQIFIQISGTHLNYDLSGEQGWKLNDDSTKILLPEYVVRRESKTVNFRHTTYRWTRAIVSTTVYNNSTLSGSTVKGIVEPNAYSNEPYFIITTADAGAIKDFDIIATDDDGGVNLKVFKETAKSFTDLPNQCQHGFRLGVVGDNQKKEDDFHVVFEGSAGSGYWKETVGYNQYNYFDLSTMPHTLRQNSDLSFTLGQGEWHERKAGDDNTNTAPSFVGQKISDIFFHRNRLGVLSGENVIFSEASGYFNFWRTTVRSLLDSDPIDVTVSQNEVSELKAAVPVQDNLLLFSELNQFTLSASQLLTPSEITVDQSTKYECDLTAPPVGAGNSVFFATQSSGYAGVREFFTRETTEVRDAASVTSHVPTYLEGNIRQFASSSNEDMLSCLTSSNKKECYIYKWYNSAEERLQSAWSKWIFTEDIAHIFFTNNLMYFTFEDGSYEILDVRYDHTEVLLDRQITVTRDNWSNEPLDIPFTAPQASGYGSNVLSYTAIDESGLAHDLLYNTTTKVFFHDAATQTAYDATANGKTLIIGVPYTFKYQMSEQVFKPTQGDSTQLARFQLKKLSFNYNDTGHFDVTVDSVGRSPVTSHFTGRVLDNQHNLLDQSAVIDDGAFQVGVQAQASQTDITITNDSHLPSTFQSAEWEGYIVLRNQRL